MRATQLLRTVLLLALLAPSQRSEVESVTIETREPFFGGADVPSIGPYERVVGTIDFVYDPTNSANENIVDLGLAPRDENGMVRARGDFVVLQARDPDRRRGTAFFEVVNRGGFASMRYFNDSPTGDPRVEGDQGNGWLLRQGLTLIWIGWQFDVPEGERRLRLEVPRVLNGVRGLVRSDWTVDERVDTLELSHRNHIAYPVLDPNDEANVLTVRTGRFGQRSVVPRSTWRFAKVVDGEVVEDRTHIHAPRGFEPGRIYELVYAAEEPAVVGLGLAAIRDVMAYAKYDRDCPFRVQRGVAFGVSQTGRFLRHFLYEGMNVDEEGRQVFDGMLIHTAGAGRGSFNHRFGQPSRDAHRYSAFSYPTDLFPFSGRTQRDPVLGKKEGLLSNPRQLEHLPKIVYTNTGYEYWGRAASLLHTSLDGSADVDPLPNERIYHLAGGQHFVAPFPPRKGSTSPASADAPVWRGNPLDFRFALRAIARNLFEWVENGVEPPASAYPRIDANRLVPLHELAFPKIPGLRAPRIVHEVRRRDYGGRWSRGIIDVQPPELGPAYSVLVPQVDELGNELGGWPSVELLVPVATYTPWRLRADYEHASDELEDFYGNFAPLAVNEASRDPNLDERPSLEMLYSNEEAYLEKVQFAIRQLIDRRFLLEEDLMPAMRRAADYWRFVHGPE